MPKAWPLLASTLNAQLGRAKTYFFLDEGRWAKADPAADLEAGEVRPSRSVFDAADADGADVTFLGWVWESALPAAVLEVGPVFGLESVLEADLAADGEVTLPAPFVAAADCALAAKLPFCTVPPLLRASALWIREAAPPVMGVLDLLALGLLGGFVAMKFSLSVVVNLYWA